MNKGYTLVEVLVAASLFSLILSSLMGFAINAIGIQRNSLSNQELINNISYSLEYMVRSLRMAKKDDLGGTNCLSGDNVNYELVYGGTGIKFRNYRNNCQAFFLDEGRLKEWKLAEGLITESFLTSDNIRIESFTIGPEDSWDQTDYEQAKVTLFIKAVASTTVESAPSIKVQTTVSQRNLDVQY